MKCALHKNFPWHIVRTSICGAIIAQRPHQDATNSRTTSPPLDRSVTRPLRWEESRAEVTKVGEGKVSSRAGSSG